MQVFVATSLDLINWLLGLFVSSKKKVNISDHSNKIDESLSLPVYILLAIVIGLVLLHLYRFGENKEINSNTNEVEDEELEHTVDESDRDFVWDWQLSPRTSEHGGAAKRNTPCAFCGDPSTKRCARCKVARYWLVH
jgi:quinol-cytochrome oxidoreductase complex cytochrome b subunit